MMTGEKARGLIFAVVLSPRIRVIKVLSPKVRVIVA